MQHAYYLTISTDAILHKQSDSILYTAWLRQKNINLLHLTWTEFPWSSGYAVKFGGHSRFSLEGRHNNRWTLGLLIERDNKYADNGQ